jgi:4'-phosphopantetheinyl transferase
MIDWLIQSSLANPNLMHGVAPDGLLSASEMRRLAAIGAHKRRGDWLLGRWTAKQLIQSYIERRTGTRIPLHLITIASDPDGAPRVIADNNSKLASAISDLQLSISHSHGHAFCALSGADTAIGADIERIEPRAAVFAEDYFTPHEQQQILSAPPETHDTLVTLIWSAKEAVLKSLRLGLTVDTRSVSIDLAASASTGLAWAPLLVRSSPPSDRARGRLCGWWRVTGEYVLTLALAQAA